MSVNHTYSGHFKANLMKPLYLYVALLKDKSYCKIYARNHKHATIIVNNIQMQIGFNVGEPRIKRPPLPGQQTTSTSSVESEKVEKKEKSASFQNKIYLIRRIRGGSIRIPSPKMITEQEAFSLLHTSSLSAKQRA